VNNLRSLFAQSGAALRLLLVSTVVLGLLYPGLIYAVGRLMPGRADGSMVSVDGRPAGSRLLGQAFDGDQWFQPRPSAAGEGYDALASAASNLGPNNPDLAGAVEARRAEVAGREQVDLADVPPDAVTASGSGLDPDISPEYARLQVARVARVRGLPVEDVEALVDSHVQGRQLTFLGEPRVNVLELNLALTQLVPGPQAAG
jgi:K+-transporting ATPase ATPase C chain